MRQREKRHLSGLGETPNANFGNGLSWCGHRGCEGEGV